MGLVRYSPGELLAKYQEIRDSCTTDSFMRSPLHQKTQEMWCAAHFSKAYQTVAGDCWVHISEKDEQTPEDFWLEFKDVLHPFQIAMVVDPARRMGDEYKGVIDDKNVSVLEDWTTGTENGPSWIATRIAAKAEKYGEDSARLNLLLYLNFTAYEQNHWQLRNEANLHSEKFRSVWLLNGNAFCCIKEHENLPGFQLWQEAAESLRAREN